MTDHIFLASARAALPLIPTLVTGSLRVSIILAVALGSLWMLKDTSARLRHILWLSVIGGSVFVFGLSITGPVFHVAFKHISHRGTFVALSSALLPATGAFMISGGMHPFAAQQWRQISMGREWLSLWPSVVLVAWAVGALSGWLRIIGGRLHLLRLAKESRDAAHEYRQMALTLARRIGIRRLVRVVESCQISTPLAWGMSHPVIFLPSRTRGWSSARKKSVLLHELRHIKRGDSWSLAIAYVFCSFLWFVPLVWIAYARLYLEQEKACDAAVIESGVSPDSYASCILKAAKLTQEPAPLAGLAFSGRRKKFLRERIRAIVGEGRSVKKAGGLFGLAVLCLGAAVLLGALGEDKGTKYGAIYQTEYQVRSADEAGIIDTLIRFESFYNTHDLPGLLSLFTKGALYMPHGCWYAKLPVESSYCQYLIERNFSIFRFETFYDPKITVEHDRAAVRLLLESADYLSEYTFLMKKEGRRWLVTETSYEDDRVKG